MPRTHTHVHCTGFSFAALLSLIELFFKLARVQIETHNKNMASVSIETLNNTFKSINK